jgi:predicted GH43/DUF377 family glycosyl hydrolase
MSEIVLQQPKPAPKLPPRIARNKSAMEKYLADNSIVSQWPSISNQLFTHVVKGLPIGSYNNSIIRFRGRLVMTYRFHDGTAKTKLGIAELDENFTVFYSETLSLDEDETLSLEDARLFIWKGELWLNFVVSTWPNFPSSQVKICKLYKPDHWRFSDKEQYWLPDRQTTEKNHCPIVHDDVLHIVYRNNQPQECDLSKLSRIIYTPADKREMKTPALRWPYGEIRGGTVPILYQGKLLSFFHSHLDSFMPTTTWCYFIGAMLMKAEPPFQMLSVSKRPILYGSEIGGDETRFHHKKNVVFALGAIEHDGGWLLSCGQNDSASLLVKIKEKDLMLE